MQSAVSGLRNQTESQMTREELERASRDELIAYLEGWGFQCYDHETTDELRAAALENQSTEGA